MRNLGLERRGLTILEVIIALVVIGVAFTILSTALVGSLRTTELAGTRTQTTQYLNYIGRLVSGADNRVLPAVGETRTWAYGAMAAAFPDLPGGTAGRNNPNLYRTTVESLGWFSFAGANSVQYRVTVCTQASAGEACVAGTTLGSPPYTDEPTGTLPGIN